MKKKATDKEICRFNRISKANGYQRWKLILGREFDNSGFKTGWIMSVHGVSWSLYSSDEVGLA